MVTEDKMLALLRDECDKAGSQVNWARANKIALSYLSDVLNRRTPAGPKVLAALGLRLVKTYEVVGL